MDFLEQMTVPYVIPGLPTVEINSKVKEVEYTQYMQGIEKLVPKIKALYDNVERSTRIIHATGGWEHESNEIFQTILDARTLH